jgi:YggT family protein
MTTVVAVAAAVLLVFQLLLVARAALGWSAMLLGPSAQGSVRDRLADLTIRLTEPVIGPVRRLLPSLRLGAVALDTAFIAVFLAVSVLRQALHSLLG